MANRGEFAHDTHKREIEIYRGRLSLILEQEVQQRKVRGISTYVGAVEIFPVGGDVVTAPMLTSEKSVDVNELHCLLGHVSEDKSRAVAKYYGVKVIGKFNTCSACAGAKAQKSNIRKEIPEGSKSTIVGTNSLGGAKYWLLVMDKATGYCFSFFLRQKKDTPTTIVQLIKHLRSKGKHVKKIRCDNSGENQKTDA